MSQLIPVASSFPTCLAMKKYHKDMTKVKHFMTQFPGHLSGHICPHERAKFQKLWEKQKHTPTELKGGVLEMLAEQLGLLFRHVYQIERSDTFEEAINQILPTYTVTTDLVCIWEDRCRFQRPVSCEAFSNPELLSTTLCKEQIPPHQISWCSLACLVQVFTFGLGGEAWLLAGKKSHL